MKTTTINRVFTVVVGLLMIVCVVGVYVDLYRRHLALAEEFQERADKLEQPTTTEMAEVVADVMEDKAPAKTLTREESEHLRSITRTLETNPGLYPPVVESGPPAGWIYDGTGPRPIDLPPRLDANHEFDGGPDFGGDSWAQKGADDQWRRYWLERVDE